MNRYFFDDIVQNLCMGIDKYVLSHLKIKWNHKYEWKKHPYLPPEEMCKNYGIQYGEEQPGAFQLVLYDHGKPVYSAGCILIGKYFNQTGVDRTYDRFFDAMKSYQENHEFFLLFLWYLQKKTHITLYNDASK